MLNTISVRQKMYALIAVAIAGTLILLILALYTHYKTLEETRQQELRHLVENGYSIIESHYQSFQNGALTEAEAKTRALEDISKLRYDNGNYFWVNDYHPHVVMHPIKPELNGKDATGIKDPNGKALFVAFAEKVKADGEGVVDYYWPKPGFEKPVEKFSFVKGFAPWEWVLGTGAYVDDLKAEFQSSLIAGLTIALAIIALVIACSLMIIRSITLPLSHIEKVLLDVEESGDLSRRIESVRKDELGRVANATNHLFDRWRKFIGEAGHSVKKLGDGDFGSPITSEYKGDMQQLREHINHSIAVTGRSMGRINSIMEAMAAGRLTTLEEDHRIQGEFARTLTLVNKAVEQFQHTIRIVQERLQAMREGVFDNRIEETFPGDLNHLKVAINDTLDTLASSFARLEESFRRLSQGQLDLRTRDKQPGQFGELQDHLRQTIRSLHEIAIQCRSDSTSLTSSTGEVSSASRDLSRRTEEQASAIESATRLIGELREELDNTSELAKATRNVSETAAKEAQLGLSVSATTLEAMSSIKSSSEKINNIIGVINDIAFQTNLLALNASVEAARAGEQGRGFSVVAAEVRALAQRSADAAKDIKSLIELAVTGVGKGSDQVSQMAEQLKTIAAGIEEVSGRISSVSQSNSIQTTRIRDVFTQLEQLKDITHRNASMAEQTAATSESLVNMADSLDDKLSFFKT
ncbi:Methyl-accepting chemotaxis protein [Hahella chejuensis KCTC 2396]|uniref:Methyl-accepting chemotaxis protein n=1 Tax=Hahella chejuensis (strain KCTC 2396) TaxID=349521 RepID=Q2SDB6_HAHCH|nr:cache domain-containing protein [Hahella chejuensis]ABC31358.1 Methyl-accepting chemotaxis protein [Hahella chejuensis KCTC 2396]